MQGRCPQCGNDWIPPYRRIGSIWRALAALWAVVWCMVAAMIAVAAFAAGRLRGWEIGGRVAVAAAAALLIALIPRLVISVRGERRERAARQWQCRSCGFRWTADDASAAHEKDA
jgi:hypothetical protein